MTRPAARIQNVRMGGRKKTKGGTGSSRDLDITCPCCQTRLLVDAATGVVLREDRKKRPKKSFDEALAAEKARRLQRDDAFGKALTSQKNQQALLDRKFEEAIKKAGDEPDEKPPHPFDWD